MIVEAFKLISSVFPFIKEAFLWRDGAEVGKPVTAHNLRLRKVAVFVLFASLLTNYLSISSVFRKTGELDKLRVELKKEQDRPVELVAPNNCVPPNQVFELARQEIEAEIQMGLLRRPEPGPPASPPKKRPH